MRAVVAMHNARPKFRRDDATPTRPMPVNEGRSLEPDCSQGHGMEGEQLQHLPELQLSRRRHGIGSSSNR